MSVMTTIAVIITSLILNWPLKLFATYQTGKQNKMITHITIMSQTI